MRITSVIASGFIAAAAFAAPAYAVAVPDGTLTVANLYTPTVSFGATTSTFDATNGTTFVFGGTGGFASLAPTALSNGTIEFSNTVGATLSTPVTDFVLSFSGYTFTIDSVKTLSFLASPTSSAVSLYLLGSTAGAGFDATATSLTLTFNNTSGSNFSSSATLAVPPESIGSVPEAATWGMMVLGFGTMGATMRRKRTSITFA